MFDDVCFQHLFCFCVVFSVVILMFFCELFGAVPCVVFLMCFDKFCMFYATSHLLCTVTAYCMILYAFHTHNM